MTAGSDPRRKHMLDVTQAASRWWAAERAYDAAEPAARKIAYVGLRAARARLGRAVEALDAFDRQHAVTPAGAQAVSR